MLEEKHLIWIISNRILTLEFGIGLYKICNDRIIYSRKYQQTGYLVAYVTALSLNV